jgi:hypothetical protein
MTKGLSTHLKNKWLALRQAVKLLAQSGACFDLHRQQSIGKNRCAKLQLIGQTPARGRITANDRKELHMALRFPQADGRRLLYCI